jgi:6-pyruvoyltetrahydropterin/6-carboxytetrahydropterin synthase
MIQVYKEFGFEAAHRLPSARPDDPNARVHGHSFRVRVVIEGEPDPATGLTFHFGDFEAALASVKDKLDHRYLNDIQGLEMPTVERLAIWIWERLDGVVPGLLEVQVDRPTCGEGALYRPSPL